MPVLPPSVVAEAIRYPGQCEYPCPYIDAARVLHDCPLSGRSRRSNVRAKAWANVRRWPIAPIQLKTLKPTFAKAGRGSPTAKMAEADSRSAHLARLTPNQTRPTSLK